MTNLEALKIRQHTDRRLLDITQAVDILELENPDMAITQEEADLIKAFDDATNGVADRITRIINTPKFALSPEAKSAFQGEVDRLKGLGQDPENPIPATA